MDGEVPTKDNDIVITLAKDEVREITISNLYNEPPVAVDDGPYTIYDDEILELTAPGIIGNDYDPDTDSFGVLHVWPQSGFHGSLNVGTDGSFEYTPLIGYTGTFYVVYEIEDQYGLTGIATVTIEVIPRT